MTPASSGPGWWRRRRHPSLCGTLAITSPTGRSLAIPLRGRATVLTPRGTGLPGHGEVWAVHVDAAATITALMIQYGPSPSAGSSPSPSPDSPSPSWDSPSPEDIQSGLCYPGQTVTLAGSRFTWHHPDHPPLLAPPSAAAPGAPPSPTTAGSSPSPATAGTSPSPAVGTSSSVPPAPPSSTTPRGPANRHAPSAGEIPHPRTEALPPTNAPAPAPDARQPRNARTPQPRPAPSDPAPNARDADPPNLRQRVQALFRDLTHSVRR
ncbi:hypothetical protein [Actinoplanes sp. NPDC051851]|uniref:hypothetical protein n=1 Tax=Actinoplanes sp. NPDC051851 TaxID=3154753 RepID=UPI0034214092